MNVAFLCNGETWTYLKIAFHVICGRYWFRGRTATASKMQSFYVKIKKSLRIRTILVAALQINLKLHYLCNIFSRTNSPFWSIYSKCIIRYSWNYFKTSWKSKILIKLISMLSGLIQYFAYLINLWQLACAGIGLLREKYIFHYEVMTCNRRKSFWRTFSEANIDKYADKKEDSLIFKP